MFIGHYGVGLAAKKTTPRISLGTLFMAAQWLDLLWPIFLILNIEHVTIHPGDTKMTPLNFDYYPFSHSLLFVLIWSVLFGSVYFIFRRNLKNSIVLSLLVLSHWVLDLFVHRPDLALYPGGPFEGIGLWNYPIIALILEFLIYITGIILYLTTTKPKDKTGTYSFWGLIILLVLFHIVNLSGPPPPDEKMIGYASLSLWLIVLWAYWTDRHRVEKNQ